MLVCPACGTAPSSRPLSGPEGDAAEPFVALFCLCRRIIVSPDESWFCQGACRRILVTLSSLRLMAFNPETFGYEDVDADAASFLQDMVDGLLAEAVLQT